MISTLKRWLRETRFRLHGDELTPWKMKHGPSDVPESRHELFWCVFQLVMVVLIGYAVMWLGGHVIEWMGRR